MMLRNLLVPTIKTNHSKAKAKFHEYQEERMKDIKKEILTHIPELIAYALSITALIISLSK